MAPFPATASMQRTKLGQWKVYLQSLARFCTMGGDGFDTTLPAKSNWVVLNRSFSKLCDF
jgi:hypothetical protein